MMKKNTLLIQLVMVAALFTGHFVQASSFLSKELDHDETFQFKTPQSNFLSTCSGCGTCSRGQGFSTEGECFDCELAKHPKRFQGCPSCRQPQKSSGFCQPCRFGFKDWIYRQLVKSDDNSTDTQDHKFYQKIYLSQAADKIMRKHKPVQFIRDSAQTHSRNKRIQKKKWVGFYIGNCYGQHIWLRNPEIRSQDIKIVRFSTAQAYLENIIDLYSLLDINTQLTTYQNNVIGMRAVKK